MMQLTTNVYCNRIEQVDDLKLISIVLENAEIKVELCNVGASIVSLMTKDQAGHVDDIALGFASLQEYLTNTDNYMGGVVGRYANRINKGRFELHGVAYQLTINNGPNHLHGGLTPINTKVWAHRIEQDAVVFSLACLDGEGGYPGNVQLQVTYRLHGNSLEVRYDATTDQDTILNLSQHVYFNLDGHDSGSIQHHQLELCAQSFVEIDEHAIPSGNLLDVAGTPFDFCVRKDILADIDLPDVQLAYGNGYDHCFVLDDNKKSIACLSSTKSGRMVEIETSKPGLQVYTGNYLNAIGKQNARYGFRSGIALETQCYPDSVNHGNFPSCVITPKTPYHHMTRYIFGTKTM